MFHSANPDCIQLAWCTDKQRSNASTYARRRWRRNEGPCAQEQRASVDNVNILLISSAFQLLSGSKALAIRSLSLPPRRLSQTPNPTNPARRSAETLLLFLFFSSLRRPAGPRRFWLAGRLFTNLVMERLIRRLMRSDRFAQKWEKMSLRFD